LWQLRLPGHEAIYRRVIARQHHDPPDPRRFRYRGVGAEPSFARSKSLTSTARLFGTMPEPNLRA
jgi:hypothetical protein